MNWTAVRLGTGVSKAVQLAAIAVAGGLLAAGCRSGGGSSGSRGIDETDEHGNTPLTSTVVIPDGANIHGQINYGGDVDWFVFRGIIGVSYALQVTGFPPDPDVDLGLDLTGDGDDSISVQILDNTGAVVGGQLENSSGTEGGEPYDIFPAGVEDDGLLVLGDTRFFWVCPFTNDFHIAIRHRRPRTAVGAYEIRLASSQLTTIQSDEPDLQTGARFVEVFDAQGVELWDNWISGGIQSGYFEYLEDINAIIFQTPAAFRNLSILLPNQTEPEDFEMHMHFGFPNIYDPEGSSEQAPSGDTHDSVLAQTFAGRSSPSPSREMATQEATLQLADGTTVRVPIMEQLTPIDKNGNPMAPGEKQIIYLDDAVIGGRDIGPAEMLTPEVRRLFHAFAWYYDLHPMDPDEQGPVAVSLPRGDHYQFFESRLEASSANVVTRDGARLSAEGERGFAEFNILYDASLKTFQVAMQSYFVFAGTLPGPGSEDLGNGFDVGDNNVSPPLPFIIDPDYAPFVGDRVRVHAGGPGEVGPVLFDLGTLPELRVPELDDGPGDILGEPGFRNPIRQLTDAEAEELRDAFYGDGFYVEVTDRFTGEPLVRAEGDLEISTFPTADPCNFPPCSGVDAGEMPSKGTITFASGLAGEGAVELYANGVLLGALSTAVTQDNPPACGLDGDDRTLAAELWPGTYYWHAHGRNGKMWDGHFTVTGGECNLVVIEADDLKQD